MCGRYQLSDDENTEELKKIINEIDANPGESVRTVKTGEIRPGDWVPVLFLSEKKPVLELMHWGFAKWDGKGLIINARSESAADKKMFRNSLLSKRCVIPSTGFFEWAKKDGKSTGKYLFRVKGSPMLYMAAIYDSFNIGTESENRFVILTRAADGIIADIHDRMPIILCKHELLRWLNDDAFANWALSKESPILERFEQGR